MYSQRKEVKKKHHEDSDQLHIGLLKLLINLLNIVKYIATPLGKRELIKN